MHEQRIMKPYLGEPFGALALYAPRLLTIRFDRPLVRKLVAG